MANWVFGRESDGGDSMVVVVAGVSDAVVSSDIRTVLEGIGW